MFYVISALETNWDNITVAIIFYGIVSIMCVIVGVLAIKYGYKLYIKGVGLNPDGTSIKYENVSINLKSVGGVLMFTSVAWGILAYFVLPSLKDGDAELAGINNGNQDIQVTVAELSDYITIYESSLKNDSLATVASWSILAQKDNASQAKAAVSYGYREGIGFPKNIDSSKAWFFRAFKEHGYNTQVDKITTVELDSIYDLFLNFPKNH